MAGDETDAPKIARLIIQRRAVAPILTTQDLAAIVCEARVGLSSWTRVFLENLSTHGFQIARVPGLRVGERLRLRVPGFELLTATVRWLDSEHAGCAFEKPLAEYVLDHIVSQGRN